MNIEDKIINAVQATVELVSSTKDFSRTNWTKCLKDSLEELGNELKFDSSSHGKGHEWLYDFLWYRMGYVEDRPHLAQVELVVESEWNLGWGELRYDFEKLLVAKCPYKLMVCDEKPDGAEKLFQLHEEAIRVYHGDQWDEKYIIAIYDNINEEFNIKVI